MPVASKERLAPLELLDLDHNRLAVAQVHMQEQFPARPHIKPRRLARRSWLVALDGDEDNKGRAGLPGAARGLRNVRRSSEGGAQNVVRRSPKKGGL